MNGSHIDQYDGLRDGRIDCTCGGLYGRRPSFVKCLKCAAHNILDAVTTKLGFGFIRNIMRDNMTDNV